MSCPSKAADAPTQVTKFHPACSVVNKPDPNSKQLPQWWQVQNGVKWEPVWHQVKNTTVGAEFKRVQNMSKCGTRQRHHSRVTVDGANVLRNSLAKKPKIKKHAPPLTSSRIRNGDLNLRFRTNRKIDIFS